MKAFSLLLIVLLAFGCAGEDGAVGPMGPQGEAGAQGEQGERGLQGFDGETGVDGARGPQGERGPEGPQGVQGESGSVAVLEIVYTPTRSDYTAGSNNSFTLDDSRITAANLLGVYEDVGGWLGGFSTFTRTSATDNFEEPPAYAVADFGLWFWDPDQRLLGTQLHIFIIATEQVSDE